MIAKATMKELRSGTPKRLLEHLVTAVIVFSLTVTWKNPIELTAPRIDLVNRTTTSASIVLEEGKPPTRFLLGIFSRQKDKELRQLVRSTMLGPDLPESTRSRLCSLQEYLLAPEKKDGCQIMYTFVIGGNASGSMSYKASNATKLLIENKTFTKQEPDSILLNIRENMNQGKTPSYFYYASTLLDRGIDYVGKADLDTLFSVPQLLDFINQELPPRYPDPHIFGGFMMDYIACGGGGPDCDPLKNKVYMSGQFYFCSHDVVNFLSTVRWNTTFKGKEGGHEDLNFAIRVWGYNHPVKIVALNTDYFWQHPLKGEDAWMKGYNWTKSKGWDIHMRKFDTDVFKK